MIMLVTHVSTLLRCDVNMVQFLSAYIIGPTMFRQHWENNVRQHENMGVPAHFTILWLCWPSRMHIYGSVDPL